MVIPFFKVLQFDILGRVAGVSEHKQHKQTNDTYKTHYMKVAFRSLAYDDAATDEALRFTREFKDVVSEDVVFDNNSYVTPY